MHGRAFSDMSFHRWTAEIVARSFFGSGVSGMRRLRPRRLHLPLPPCGDKPALDAMASQGSVGSTPSGAALVPWKENVLASPAFRYVIEEFLNASRQHDGCLECCNTELNNNRCWMRFLMCNTDLAGKVKSRAELSEYYAAWWWTERMRFVRLEQCKRDNEMFCTRRARIRGNIVTRARRHAEIHAGDGTTRMRDEILFLYIQSHSECVGNPMDRGLPPLQRGQPDGLQQWATRWATS